MNAQERILRDLDEFERPIKYKVKHSPVMATRRVRRARKLPTTPAGETSRGYFTRDRNARGMNPKRRKRREQRKIERQMQAAKGPLSHYKAYAYSAPFVDFVRSELLAGPILVPLKSPVETAKVAFQQDFGLYEYEYMVKLRGVIS